MACQGRKLAGDGAVRGRVRIAEERRVKRCPNRCGDWRGVDAHSVTRFDAFLHRLLDKNPVQGLQRLGPNAADIVLQTGTLRRRISDAKQAEGAIGEGVGEVKLQLLEVDHEQQIQDQHAQDLLGAESVADNVSANLRGHQVSQDLLLQRR